MHKEHSMMDENFTLCLAVLLLVMCIGLYALSVSTLKARNMVEKLTKDLVIEALALEVQTEKVARYEMIITDMMQGQWRPEMGLDKRFEGVYYGTEIWVWKAVNRPPGSLKVDIGEIIDREISEK